MFEDLDQNTEVKEFLIRFSKNPRGFVLLSGKNGTGKTYASMAVYQTVSPFKLPAFDHGIAIFISQTNLNLKWTKYLKTYGDTTLLLEEISSPKLLILDDIGTRTPSEAFMDFLYAIVDKRYEERNLKGTILTTNLNANSMREKFGDAFVSRVASGKCFRFEGQDRRFLSSNRNRILIDLDQKTQDLGH